MRARLWPLCDSPGIRPAGPLRKEGSPVELAEEGEDGRAVGDAGLPSSPGRLDRGRRRGESQPAPEAVTPGQGGSVRAMEDVAAAGRVGRGDGGRGLVVERTGRRAVDRPAPLGAAGHDYDRAIVAP